MLFKTSPVEEQRTGDTQVSSIAIFALKARRLQSAGCHGTDGSNLASLPLPVFQHFGGYGSR